MPEWVEVVIEPKSGPERTLQEWRRYGKEFRTEFGTRSGKNTRRLNVLPP